MTVPSPCRRPQRAARVAAQEGKTVSQLSDLTLAEIVYVLQGPYDRPRDEVAVLVEATLSLASVVVDSEALLRRTLGHTASGFRGGRRVDRCAHRPARRLTATRMEGEDLAAVLAKLFDDTGGPLTEQELAQARQRLALAEQR